MSSSSQNDVKDAPMRKGSHNALEITDIIDLILLKLNEDKEAKKADLLSMAQCCKAFEDPSLSRLWASMSSVVPLLTLIHGAEESQGSLIITDELHLKELTPRFYNYAKRILDLSYDVTTDFAHVDVSTWIRLAHLESALLPNLRSLKISCAIVGGVTSVAERDKSLLLLPALARPSSITSFTFQMPSATSYNTRLEVGPFLSILSDYKLDIETLVASGTFIARYTNVLATMQSLRSVSLQLSLDSSLPDVLTALASLPRLNTLNLEFLGSAPSPVVMGAHSFHDLLKIVLKGGISFISRTLASITGPYMEHVDVQVLLVNVPGTADIPPAQESVLPYLQLSRFPTLKQIIVDLGGCASPSYSGGRENRLNFVAPILGNHCIEDLVVTSLDPAMCLSDYEIAELATAWPILKTLRLEHMAPPAAQPSFASLDHLAKCCPRLTELSLTLWEGEFQGHGHDFSLKPVHNLRELNLQHTTIQRYARAGGYIDELFPFLNKFHMLEQTACGYMRDVIFEACQVVRKSDRRRRRVDDVRSSNGKL